MHALPISSTNPESWADFGSYVGGVLGPVFGFLSLVVVVYIAVRVTELQQTDLAIKRLSLDLYNEWHGDEPRIEYQVAGMLPVVFLPEGDEAENLLGFLRVGNRSY